MGWFNKSAKKVVDQTPTAFPINFRGKAPYSKNLNEEFGVVFEDDGDTGYFYATNAAHTEIYDALHLYDRPSAKAVEPGDKIFIVWNSSRLKAGIYYHDRFQAIFDFPTKRGICRNNFGVSTPTQSGWSAQGHAWDESMEDGLKPK